MSENTEKKKTETLDEITKSLEDVHASTSNQDSAQSSTEDSSTGLRPTDYEFVNFLSRGGFANVVLVKRRKDGERLAIKIMYKHCGDTKTIRKTKEHAKNEKKFLPQFDHPFIIKMICTFHTEARIYLALKFASGGELFYHMRKSNLSKGSVQLYAAEIVSALEYLHNMNIMYRDLKSENVLLGSDGHILLADFGVCKIYNQNEANGKRNRYGTIENFAPEILSNEHCDYGMDWWAFGVMLYELTFRHHPFANSKKKVLKNNILKVTPRMLENPEENDDVVDLIGKLLIKESDKKLGSNGADEVKGHDYFSDIKWDELYEKKCIPPFVPIAEDIENAPWFIGDGEPFEYTDNTNVKSDDDDDDDFRGFTSVVTYDKADSQDVDKDT